MLSMRHYITVGSVVSTLSQDWISTHETSTQRWRVSNKRFCLGHACADDRLAPILRTPAGLSSEEGVSHVLHDYVGRGVLEYIILCCEGLGTLGEGLRKCQDTGQQSSPRYQR